MVAVVLVVHGEDEVICEFQTGGCTPAASTGRGGGDGDAGGGGKLGQWRRRMRREVGAAAAREKEGEQG